MANKILSIIETAYRATLEEQDDTVVWLMHQLCAAGMGVTVVLRGNAVCYASREQDASGLVFGDRRQTNPPRLERDVAALATSGVDVLVIDEDLVARGLEAADLIDGVRLVPREAMVKLAGAHEHVWHW